MKFCPRIFIIKRRKLDKKPNKAVKSEDYNKIRQMKLYPLMQCDTTDSLICSLLFLPGNYIIYLSTIKTLYMS